MRPLIQDGGSPQSGKHGERAIGQKDGGQNRYRDSKKAPDEAGAEVRWKTGRSVAGDDRSPEFVVQAKRDHVDVLADAVERASKQGISHRERVVRIAHEEVVVLKANRPVRSEAVFKSDTYGATPAG
jgi:hypothetical protein